MKKIRWSIVSLVVLLMALVASFQGCGESDSVTPPSDSSGEQEFPTTKIKFQRLVNSTNGQSFKVVISRPKITAKFIRETSISKGSISDWSQVDSNNLEATVTPEFSNPTGVYHISIDTADGKTYLRSPVVLASIHENLEQPELFPSPINSDGWEDSPQTFVKTDSNGKESLHFAMVYLPIRSDCIHGSGAPNAGNPICWQVAGPYEAPLRPFMNIAAFISNGIIDELLPNLMPGVPVQPDPIGNPSFYLPAKTGQTLYVFKFASDAYDGYLGTPKNNPQALFIEDDDGQSNLSSPFIFKYENSYSLMYNNDTFSDSSPTTCVGYAGDVGYDTSVDALIIGDYNFDSEKIILGDYNSVGNGQTFSTGNVNNSGRGCPELIKSSAHLSTAGIPLAGRQSNPTFYFPNNGQPVMFWDQENSHLGNLKMAVLASGQSFPGGQWNVINGLPALAAPPMVGPDQPEKTQPTMTSDKFCYRNEFKIECHPYSGGDPTQASSYGTAYTLMNGTGGVGGVGQIIGVGEPSFFNYQKKNCLSFILAEKVDNTSERLDFQIAWVCEK